MKTIILLLAVISLRINSFAQTARFEWLKRIGDSGTDCPGVIANDSLGNVYVAGSFVGQLIFGADTIHSYNASNPSIFLAKYDTYGNVIWGKKLPITNPLTVDCSLIALYKLKISQRGRIYLLGNISYNGPSRAYIAILRSDGSLAGFDDQTNDSYFADIDVDSVENAYIIGDDLNNTKFYVAKYDSSGNTKWSMWTANPSNTADDIKYVNGEVYVAGEFKNQLQLIDTVGTAPITLSATNGINDWDVFIAKYSKNGKLLSATHEDGPLPSSASRQISVSEFSRINTWKTVWMLGSSVSTKYYTPTLSVANSGSFNLTGSCMFGGASVFRNSTFSEASVFSYYGQLCQSANAYILDSAGVLKQKLSIPLTTSTNQYAPKQEFSMDPAGNVYITTGFQGSISFQDSSAGTKTLTSNQNYPDIYVGKYHICPAYAPSISRNGDTLLCNILGLSYTWMLNGAPVVQNSISPFFIATQNGSYTVKVIDPWACEATSQAFSLTNLGIQGLSSQELIMVSPNPAASSITVSGLGDHSTIQVTDLAGRVVLRVNGRGNQETIDVSGLASGMYIIKTVAGQRKFVKL